MANTLALAQKVIEMETESKAFYRAYEITGDESLLMDAQYLETDVTYLESEL
ncbi:hypothetical protein [Bacillus cereus]|uniref:hypothetical protein n=1 Tax=Bacillus cereus TaxID=1396 RepID=UPI0015C4054E|nr:hypothetical protein [Bacillus cereus]